MEPVEWNKLDRGLRTIYREWQRTGHPGHYGGEIPEITSRDAVLTIVLEHNGDLTREVLADSGFKITGTLSATAYQGELMLRDVAALSQLTNLTLLRFGTRRKKRLVTSHTDVHVQDTNPSLVNGKWHYSVIANTFSGNRGENVVVGIIDTGIDFNHPCFQSTDGTETRIHAIWDQFLTPRTGEHSPVAALLTPGTTTRYGVEYEKGDIDTNRAGVRHRDDDGHGTHVAGIAAGNGATSTGPTTGSGRTGNIGIAPETRIIAVNLLKDGTNNIGYDIRERDAFHYILNKAEALFGASTPVVINCSFGTELHPHDGRDWQGNEYIERHLHGMFHETSGKICVFSSGNAAGKNGHLQIVMPAAPNNQVDLPFTIVDTRTRPSTSVNLEMEVVYPDSVNGVKGWIKLPGLVQFFGGNAPGATSGTALNEEYDGTFGTARHRVLMGHYTVTAQSPYGNVTRRNLSLTLIPRRRRLNTGNYVFRIEAPAGTTLQLWIEVSDPDYRILFDRPAILLTTGVSIVNKATVDSPAQSPDVITVAAYDVNSGGTPFITDFSSRGPLISYDANPVIAHKPDVAAPGSNIFSANNGALARAISPNGHFVSLSGTSMSAPHIAGLVALMLQEDANLGRQDIIDAFRDSTSPPFSVLDLHHDPTPDYESASYTIPAVSPPQATPDEGGRGRLNYNDVIDQV